MKSFVNWRHPQCTVANRAQFPLWRTQKALNDPMRRGLGLKASADVGKASAGLPAPDKSRYKEDLQWIPALSAASFWVFGREHDGNHIAVGRIDNSLWWLRVAVVAG